MRKTILAVFTAIVISVSCANAQQSAVPDLSSSDWQLTEQKRGQVADGLELVTGLYDNTSQGKRAILFSAFYSSNNLTEDIYICTMVIIVMPSHG